MPVPIAQDEHPAAEEIKPKKRLTTEAKIRWMKWALILVSAHAAITFITLYVIPPLGLTLLVITTLPTLAFKAMGFDVITTTGWYSWPNTTGFIASLFVWLCIYTLVSYSLAIRSSK